MSVFSKDYLLGVLSAVAGITIVQQLIFPPHPADIGIRFEDASKATTLREVNALPEAAIKHALEDAYNNYRAGKNSIVDVKLPMTPAPGK